MRVMLTGANGQIGWELRRSLAPIGDVIALERKDCDLSKPLDLPSIVAAVGPDVIVNAAAYTAVDNAESDERLATVVNGTAVSVLADEARKTNSLLIHYSTDYVFDGTKDSPYTEADSPNPINAYGRSKLAGDQAISASGCDHLILRTSWVYAARGHNFLRTIMRRARDRETLTIVSDQIGTPTWAHEIADATAVVVQQAYRERSVGGFSSGIVNVAANGTTSWYGFAEAILDHLISRSLLVARPDVTPISSSEYLTRAVRPKNSRLATDQLRKRFGVTLNNWKRALDLCMQDKALTEG